MNDVMSKDMNDCESKVKVLLVLMISFDRKSYTINCIQFIKKLIFPRKLQRNEHLTKRCNLLKGAGGRSLKKAWGEVEIKLASRKLLYANDFFKPPLDKPPYFE